MLSQNTEVNGFSLMMKYSNHKPKRRNRTRFDELAKRVLEDTFKINPYPDIIAREALSEEIGVSEPRIHTWFQNKRSRSKKTDSGRCNSYQEKNKISNSTFEEDTVDEKHAQNTHLVHDRSRTVDEKDIINDENKRKIQSKADILPTATTNNCSYLPMLNPLNGQYFMQPVPISAFYQRPGYLHQQSVIRYDTLRMDVPSYTQPWLTSRQPPVFPYPMMNRYPILQPLPPIRSEGYKIQFQKSESSLFKPVILTHKLDVEIKEKSLDGDTQCKKDLTNIDEGDEKQVSEIEKIESALSPKSTTSSGYDSRESDSPINVCD